MSNFLNFHDKITILAVYGISKYITVPGSASSALMKRRKKFMIAQSYRTFRKASARFAVFAAVSVLALTAVGCSNPFGSSDGSGSSETDAATGGIIVRPSTGVGAQTVFPDFSEEDLSRVEAYTITMSAEFSDDGATDRVMDLDADEAGQPEGAEFEDLVPGAWTVTVEGFEDSERNDKLVQGSQSVTVERGTVKNVEVVVRPVDDEGEGTIEFTLTWPASIGNDGYREDGEYVNGYTVTLANADNDDTIELEDGDVSFSADERKLTIETEQTVVPAGRYYLTVALTSDASEPFNVVARYDELWHIAGNTTSTNSVELVESDLSFGGDATFTVRVENLDDLEEFFDGTADSTVKAGSTFTITPANTPEATYRWRVEGEFVTDGDTVPGLGTITIDEDDDGLSFTPDAGHAGRTIAVTLVVETADRTFSGTHRVNIEPAEA